MTRWSIHLSASACPLISQCSRNVFPATVSPPAGKIRCRQARTYCLQVRRMRMSTRQSGGLARLPACIREWLLGIGKGLTSHPPPHQRQRYSRENPCCIHWLKILAHRKSELVQDKLLKIADVVLLIKQDDALLVLNFVHASVGEGAEVISKQDRVSKNAGSTFVAVFKRLDMHHATALKNANTPPVQNCPGCSTKGQPSA